jgi:hypothetical protein
VASVQINRDKNYAFVEVSEYATHVDERSTWHELFVVSSRPLNKQLRPWPLTASNSKAKL